MQERDTNFFNSSLLNFQDIFSYTDRFVNTFNGSTFFIHRIRKTCSTVNKISITIFTFTNVTLFFITITENRKEIIFILHNSLQNLNHRYFTVLLYSLECLNSNFVIGNYLT